MQIIQREFSIKVKTQGFHVITDTIIENTPEISNLKCGIIHVFIKHTSASLTINEKEDPNVRADLKTHFEHLVPDYAPYYRHTFEGPGDMACHIKSAILGNSVCVPVMNGQLNLGRWQGVILCEHRTDPPNRRLIVMLLGT